jgi:hypothetical protein
MFSTLMLIAAVAASSNLDKAEESSVQSMLNEETPDVFLAKASLQQYLSRMVRKDWEGVRRLTHPKTLGAIANLKKRTGREAHNLAPWANTDVQLKTFRFTDARQAAPGVVLVQVGEDTYRTEEQGMSVDDPGVYLLFKSRGGFLVGDKKQGVELSEVSRQSVKMGYSGYVDAQVQAQARRQAAFENGKHR